MIYFKYQQSPRTSKTMELKRLSAATQGVEVALTTRMADLKSQMELLLTPKMKFNPVKQ